MSGTGLTLRASATLLVFGGVDEGEAPCIAAIICTNECYSSTVMVPIILKIGYTVLQHRTLDIALSTITKHHNLWVFINTYY